MFGGGVSAEPLLRDPIRHDDDDEDDDDDDADDDGGENDDDDDDDDDDNDDDDELMLVTTLVSDQRGGPLQHNEVSTTGETSALTPLLSIKNVYLDCQSLTSFRFRSI